MRPIDTNKLSTHLPQPADKAGTATPAADSGLSAAVRLALGSAPGEAHLPGRFGKTAQDLAKRAKAEKPTVRGAAPRKAHIGPRSGHK